MEGYKKGYKVVLSMGGKLYSSTKLSRQTTDLLRSLEPKQRLSKQGCNRYLLNKRTLPKKGFGPLVLLPSLEQANQYIIYLLSYTEQCEEFANGKDFSYRIYECLYRESKENRVWDKVYNWHISDLHRTKVTQGSILADEIILTKKNSMKNRRKP